MGIHALAPPDIVLEFTECWTAEAAATNALLESFVCKPHRAHVARVKMGIHALAPPDIVFESTECWTAVAAATTVLLESRHRARALGAPRLQTSPSSIRTRA